MRWHGRLLPFDCLEFDPKLRWIDVMNDVAFMVMDLVAHGRQDLTFSFLNAYLEHTGDYGGVRLQNSSKRVRRFHDGTPRY